jgi:hypothetical protein
VWVSLVAGLVFFVFMGDIYGWLGVNDMISVAAAGVGRAGHLIEFLFRFTVGITLGALVPAYITFGRSPTGRNSCGSGGANTAARGATTRSTWRSTRRATRALKPPAPSAACIS